MDTQGDGSVCELDEQCVSLSCDPAAQCVVDAGGGDVHCECPAGYLDVNGDGSECADVDECSTSSNCDPNSTCQNAPGSFNCTCDSGYSGDGFSCSDFDECAPGSNICSAQAVCTNTSGGFECECEPGFAGDGVTCTDQDE